MNRMKNKLQHIDFESNVGHFYIATGIFGLVFRENARRCRYIYHLWKVTGLEFYACLMSISSVLKILNRISTINLNQIGVEHNIDLC